MLPPQPGAVHGVDSLILALKRRFDPELAGRLSASYEVHFAEDRFRIAVGLRRA